ncbi:valine--tRNA ligase [Oceanotoga teriensis]|uniref:Valine--tRNA ligase n=1 Tax=Oceanotoga teriensis TaxID=515440 RepID=A0AA45C7V8_9BACT|nr:valine--tRNA ligase [Oceanotoga teriensis]MDO7977008.1 valine--tRNA ligase [Oceanotoga teriensis]PWJ95690.1 valyl-tRNA synthetase [Oceanotoga teriensis]
MDIGKRYTPHELENKWYKIWQDKRAFEPNNKGKESFTIVIPPPNITGKLHVGHALNITLQDILTRYYRMKGYDTLWLPGEDHAGIATQHVVEKHLRATEGKRREEYDREDFVGRVWDWANEYRDHIREQIKGLGASVDWSRERFTLDEGLNEAVNKVFVQLYNEGLIYRGKYIVNWCPSCGTVLADDEVEHEDENGHLWNIKYPIKDEDDFIVIATTRPETMLGDVAVAVHPSDERNKDKIGKKVILPLIGREIEIIADPYVDPEFGTGFVKITPAHDPNDYQIGIRHDLEQIQIMDEHAKINENGGIYKGLDRYEARKKIVQDLEEQGYLVEIQDHKHAVGHCYRCNTTVEPFLMDQWFVKVKPLAEEAIKAVENNDINFYPERYKKVYLNWMNEIRDWCISRQLWWGHRIPVWYCDDCGEINVSEKAPDKCQKCGSKNLIQDSDVLDTWFSSALWPFSTLGWPNKTEDVERFYPTTTLITAFDIIFFWVARMIMMGEKFMDNKPFSNVYITPLVRDKKGRKMSKSLGNGIDPLEIIKEFGADPLRFTLAILAAQGRDIKLDNKSFEPYSKFANKIWNATRFALLNLKDFEKLDNMAFEQLKVEDKWILTRMNRTIKIVDKALETFNFNHGAKAIYDFVWSELCDWYIESVKPRLFSEGEDKKIAQNVILHVFDNALRLLHPFMPYVSEELWQALPIEKEELLITSHWPEYDEETVFENDENLYIKIMESVRGIRNVKAEMNIPSSKKTDMMYKELKDSSWIDLNKNLIKNLANIDNINKVSIKPDKSGTAFVDENVEVYVPLGELIDVDAEKERLTKKIDKLELEVQKMNKKLSNKNFIEKADPEVVEDAKRRLEEGQYQLGKVKKLYEEL